MSLNSFNPSPESELADRGQGFTPDYVGLVRFLAEPFLEDPGSLRVDCEFSGNRSRVLIRVAFSGEDRGRVFGRGGRNIQAIRTVLKATAAIAGQSAHLDIYGENYGAGSSAPRERGGETGDRSRRRSHPRPRRQG